MKLKKIKENKENTPEQRAKKIKKERRKLITVIWTSTGYRRAWRWEGGEKNKRQNKNIIDTKQTQSLLITLEFGELNIIYYLENAISWTTGNCPLYQHGLYSLLNSRCLLYDLFLFQVGGKIILQQTCILPRVERYAPKHRGPPRNLRPERWKLHGNRFFTRYWDLLKYALDNLDSCSAVRSICVGICWSRTYISLFDSK